MYVHQFRKLHYLFGLIPVCPKRSYFRDILLKYSVALVLKYYFSTAADPGNILGGTEQHCCSILSLSLPYTIELCLKIHRSSTVIYTASVWVGGA